MSLTEPLIDAYDRVHEHLRIAVTNRCNLRCFYCMPEEGVASKSHEDILRFEEIERFARIVVPMGIRRLRITGGEPLVRKHVVKLIELLARIPDIQDLAMTTNGSLLAQHAQSLKDAGLRRLNISLDALSEETFRKIARHEGLDRVLEGIAVAKQAGFDEIRINSVAIPGINDEEIVPLARFAREEDLQVRFIEFMPFDADERWDATRIVSGEFVRRKIEKVFGPLLPIGRKNSHQPASDFQFADGVGRIGLINSVTRPFCESCSRLRLTADGQIRNCLFSPESWDVRSLLRGSGSKERGSNEQLAQLVRQCISAKLAGHGVDSPDFVRSDRAMYEIGG